MTLKQLFSDSSKWTQGSLVIDSNGIELLSILDKRAAAWCFSGGLCYCYQDTDYTKIRRKIQEYLKAKYSFYGQFWVWNDDPARTFEDIQRLCQELDI